MWELQNPNCLTPLVIEEAPGFSTSVTDMVNTCHNPGINKKALIWGQLLLSKDRTLTAAPGHRWSHRSGNGWKHSSHIRLETWEVPGCAALAACFRMAGGATSNSGVNVVNFPSGRSHVVPIWKGRHMLPLWLSHRFLGKSVSGCG